MREIIVKQGDDKLLFVYDKLNKIEMQLSNINKPNQPQRTGKYISFSEQVSLIHRKNKQYLHYRRRN
jgi:hypothetical protein